jgi:hypothetical protein
MRCRPFDVAQFSIITRTLSKKEASDGAQPRQAARRRFGINGTQNDATEKRHVG